ncbi:MAG: AzlD domain-containing protein [Ruminococcus sp.]|jgi:branched-subunit amino acid transport protein AzlD|nr:AzlD domain-containing protein [Ruminococcus sp.]
MSDFLTSMGIILAMAGVTAFTRFAPFIFFGRGKEPAKWIKYLGRLLPPALMSVLIIYCISSVDFIGGSHGIPELICIAVAMGLHAWKGNVLLSIGVSTVLYMVLIQAVFV